MSVAMNKGIAYLKDSSLDGFNGCRAVAKWGTREQGGKWSEDTHTNFKATLSFTYPISLDRPIKAMF